MSHGKIELLMQSLMNDVFRRVKKEEQLPQRERLDKVQGWFTRVENTESNVDKLITDSSDEVERLCLGGFCYKNYKFASFRFGKRVAQKLEVVSELKEKGREFKEAADQRKDDPMDDQIPSELTGESEKLPC
ncbi:hypothetical protein Patl1_03755 [Pistacia atlantica]|uniref:Uncharacterized protein n=1 Tax=Pistacia atlantica TaxID=434234 RepID=A0ACC1BT62_9ROSI|nr:hypothetical protein Patl1_03755 [Pistacia atlantica]